MPQQRRADQFPIGGQNVQKRVTLPHVSNILNLRLPFALCECSSVLRNELLDCERRRSGNRLDNVIDAREDSIAIVLGDLGQMLHQERRELVEIFHSVLERLDRGRRIIDSGAKDGAMAAAISVWFILTGP